jgi:hypothetical protein
MCAALTPADFQALGIPVTGSGNSDVEDDGNSVYCGYEGKAPWIEMDVFNPAGESEQNVKQVFRTAVAEGQGKPEPAKVPGADETVFQLIPATPKAPPREAITLRKGRLVLSIAIPSGAKVHEQLLSLAQTALGRLAP